MRCLFANFLDLSEKHVDCDLEHLCRTFEMQCLDAMYDFTNSKEDLRKLLAFKDSPDLKQGCCRHIINASQEETVLLHSLSIFPMSEADKIS